MKQAFFNRFFMSAAFKEIFVANIAGQAVVSENEPDTRVLTERDKLINNGLSMRQFIEESNATAIAAGGVKSSLPELLQSLYASYLEKVDEYLNGGTKFWEIMRKDPGFLVRLSDTFKFFGQRKKHKQCVAVLTVMFQIHLFEEYDTVPTIESIIQTSSWMTILHDDIIDLVQDELTSFANNYDSSAFEAVARVEGITTRKDVLEAYVAGGMGVHIFNFVAKVPLHGLILSGDNDNTNDSRT